MSAHRVDVAIVGAGPAGALLAKYLGERGHSVLLLEAGTGPGLTPAGYASYVEHFTMQLAKTPNSPYPDNPDAPAPSVLDIQKIEPGKPDTEGYFVQRGPLPFSSNYNRAVGGTMLHWLGTCLRMVPKDFRLRTEYGHGVDWPLGYDELEPYYGMAEQELGVSANVEDQAYLGIEFAPGYVYPMFRIPLSVVDQAFTEAVEGLEFDGQPLRVISTPQARNGMPNPAYDGGSGYRVVGAVGAPLEGMRCEGYSNCIPICPVQAKYNANKTLSEALERWDVTLVSQAVASRVEIHPETGRVTGITYKRYHDEYSPEYETHTVRAKTYVVAANAIESAKLLLASDACRTSGELGRNLMDHPYLLTWGLTPPERPVYPFRGPSSTSGIPTLRDGAFRSDRAAFRIEIANWGWNYAAFSPGSDVANGLAKGYFGAKLRRYVRDTVQHQVRLGFLVEQLPMPGNRVTIDPTFRDRIGEYRPVIDYDVSDYTRAGFAAAREVSALVYGRMGVKEHTRYLPSDPGYVEYDGQGYTYHGSGHLAGTHRMGKSKSDSVVNADCRAWDHENLFVVGCGSMPTIATSNPTLTMAALTYKAAEAIESDLHQ